MAATLTRTPLRIQSLHSSHHKHHNQIMAWPSRGPRFLLPFDGEATTMMQRMVTSCLKSVWIKFQPLMHGCITMDEWWWLFMMICDLCWCLMMILILILWCIWRLFCTGPRIDGFWLHHVFWKNPILCLPQWQEGYDWLSEPPRTGDWIAMDSPQKRGNA